jgi:hypothetical protein
VAEGLSAKSEIFGGIGFAATSRSVPASNESGLVEGYLHGFYVTGGGTRMDSNGAPRIILLGLRLAVKNDLVSRWMVRYSLSVNRVF